MLEARRIELPMEAFESLRAEARVQGYEFLDTTAEEWRPGGNRFDGPGEMLCGWFAEGGLLVAVGGLTADPYLRRPEVGRLRRIYVRAAWRGQGVGTAVVRYLVAEARKSFRGVRLRAENGDAARLYEGLGFVAVKDAEATHVLWF